MYLWKIKNGKSQIKKKHDLQLKFKVYIKKEKKRTEKVPIMICDNLKLIL